jgi:hypothetical protein
MAQLKTITLAKLRAEVASLKDFAADTEIFFGAGDLSFKRIESAQYAATDGTPALLYFDFNEVYTVTGDPNEAA